MRTIYQIDTQSHSRLKQLLKNHPLVINIKMGISLLQLINRLINCNNDKRR